MAAIKSNYIGIQTEDIEDTSKDVKITWTPFLRQIQEDCADIHGMSQQTLSRICKKVDTALASKSPIYIKMPTNLNAEIEAIRKFEVFSGFPHITGAINGTHIKIRKVGGDAGQYYVNRKGHYSINTQLFVVGGVWTIYFVLGLCYGAPNVSIPQIRRDANSTEAVSEDMASWLSSIHGYGALPWILILPILTRRFGRKVPFVILCVNTLIGYIVFYCSTTTTVLLISEIMQGMLVGSNMTLLIVIVTEYTSPRYRGIFMTVKSTIFFWGVWIANATGTFSHWKNIALLAFVFSMLSLTAFLWPESPCWLAMNGRFEECAASHHWLKGYDKDAENELESLIQSQKEYLTRPKRKEASWNRLKHILDTITTKAFYKPLLLSMTVMSLYNFSGKFVCSMYSIELIKKITNSESTAYTGMLILEAVTIFSMQIGCALSKYLKRRTLLLSSSSIGIMFLFLISLYLYLIRLSVIAENKIISLLLLTLFSMTISCGPMILACSVYGELTPLRYRSSSLPTLAIFSEILMASVLKVSPYIFKLFDLHGAFLFYGLSASVFAFLLYKYLPESKDKTLQEIENYFKETQKSEEVSRELMEEKGKI